MEVITEEREPTELAGLESSLISGENRIGVKFADMEESKCFGSNNEGNVTLPSSN